MIYREKQYNDTLCHFNPNHDPKTGQFTSTKGGRILKSTLKGAAVGAVANAALNGGLFLGKLLSGPAGLIPAIGTEMLVKAGMQVLSSAAIKGALINAPINAVLQASRERKYERYNEIAKSNLNS